MLIHFNSSDLGSKRRRRRCRYRWVLGGAAIRGDGGRALLFSAAMLIADLQRNAVNNVGAPRFPSLLIEILS